MVIPFSFLFRMDNLYGDGQSKGKTGQGTGNAGVCQNQGPPQLAGLLLVSSKRCSHVETNPQWVFQCGKWPMRFLQNVCPKLMRNTWIASCCFSIHFTPKNSNGEKKKLEDDWPESIFPQSLPIMCFSSRGDALLHRCNSFCKAGSCNLALCNLTLCNLALCNLTLCNLALCNLPHSCGS